MFRILILVIIIVLHSHSCSNTCEKTDRYCQCDKKCIFYGDCCYGHRNYNKIGIWSDILTCRELSRFRSIFSINKCPDPYHILQDFCTKVRTLRNNRLKHFIAVIDEDGVVYDNWFCAKCNNANQIQYLNTTVKCYGYKMRSFEEVNNLVNKNSSCNFVPEYSSILRLCSRHFVRNCPENATKTMLDNCQRNTSDEFTDGQLIYRNEHCCECWNKTCFRRYLLSQSPYMTGFSYLLNFNEWDTDNDLNNSKSTNGTTQRSATKTDYIIYYISFIFTILSILSLLVLIIIYISHTIFHSFGGYLTICLGFCLLLMNLLTLLLTNKTLSSSRFCSLIGIIQHFVALSNFIWMAIYALDLFQNLVLRSANRSQGKSLKTFGVYCVIGFGITLCIVAAATVCEYKLDKDAIIRPKYGGENCWFTSKYGGILWYFAPVCCLLTWNFLVCIVVFYRLGKTAKECRIVRQKESNNTLWLCVRLTAVFGIGYVLQIVAVLSQVTGLIVAGSLLNCLQGGFLVVCFMWTKRVRAVVTSSFEVVRGSKSSMSGPRPTPAAVDGTDPPSERLMKGM